MHNFKKIIKTIVVVAVCVTLLAGLDMALYPCTFMRNDIHAVVSNQYDDIILAWHLADAISVACANTFAPTVEPKNAVPKGTPATVTANNSAAAFLWIFFIACLLLFSVF